MSEGTQLGQEPESGETGTQSSAAMSSDQLSANVAEATARAKLLGKIVEAMPDDAARTALENLNDYLTQLEEHCADLEGEVNQSRADASELSNVRKIADQNLRMRDALQAAKEQILELKSMVEELQQPSHSIWILQSFDAEAKTAIVSRGSTEQRVAVSPELDLEEVPSGTKVFLNENGVAISTGALPQEGNVVAIRDVLSDGTRVTVETNSGDAEVVSLSPQMLGTKLRKGDLVRVSGNFAYEAMPKEDVGNLLLEEVPNISYEDIGGLEDQLEQIYEAIEMPVLHPEEYKEFGLRQTKGVLLYGPPGCGKTLIAKAVANSLAKKAAAQRGETEHHAYFINIKGPELLNKWVGETERQIRMVFQQARDMASEGWPVVIFFDEMESLFRTRGTGISADMESTTVPQLLAELDGVEELHNVVVIGASNREDLIDPAVLRPGRLDKKIRVARPDATAATSIFNKYLTTKVPLDPASVAAAGGDKQRAVDRMIADAVTDMYRKDPSTQFLEVTYQQGDRETLYFCDFSSGAMIENIVNRAKQSAVKRAIAGGVRGVRGDDIAGAVAAEFKENEDLPNTSNPDDWAKVSGKKGERIVHIRSLVHSAEAAAVAKPTAEVKNPGGNTGQYL